MLLMVLHQLQIKRFVHVELSETSNPDKFKSSYERYVKLLAKILKIEEFIQAKVYGHIKILLTN